MKKLKTWDPHDILIFAVIAGYFLFAISGMVGMAIVEGIKAAHPAPIGTREVK